MKSNAPTDAGAPPSAVALDAYRAALAALLERCLASVREFDLPESTEPLLKPDE